MKIYDHSGTIGAFKVTFENLIGLAGDNFPDYNDFLTINQFQNSGGVRSIFDP